MEIRNQGKCHPRLWLDSLWCAVWCGMNKNSCCFFKQYLREKCGTPPAYGDDGDVTFSPSRESVACQSVDRNSGIPTCSPPVWGVPVDLGHSLSDYSEEGWVMNIHWGKHSEDSEGESI